MATQVQILDKTDCISHSTNTLGKAMNPIILPPAMGNSRTDWVLQPWWGNLFRRRKTLNSNQLNLKIDLVSYPAWAEGLVNKYTETETDIARSAETVEYTDLNLCRGVIPTPNECLGYDTKQSDGEVPVMPLPLLPGPLWPGVLAPDRALSMV